MLFSPERKRERYYIPRAQTAVTEEGGASLIPSTEYRQSISAWSSCGLYYETPCLGTSVRRIDRGSVAPVEHSDSIKTTFGRS